jgi:hypothetical protein
MGQGRGSGGRQGSGAGRGGGRGPGRQGGSEVGPGGYCVCPSCGERKLHQVGVPCYKEKCPKCGTRMTRER